MFISQCIIVDQACSGILEILPACVTVFRRPSRLPRVGQLEDYWFFQLFVVLGLLQENCENLCFKGVMCGSSCGWVDLDN